MSNCLIISFDGGGIKGLISIVILKRLIKENPTLLSRVNLLSGTSTGGIIALCLADEIPLETIKNLYYENGKRIFKKSKYNFWGLSKGKYTNQQLKEILEEKFKERTLGDLKKKILIPSFDLDSVNGKRTWKPKFFDNIKKDEPDRKELIRNVALYTSSAPTYFPIADGYIDGGVVCVNSSMAAVSNALNRNVKLEDIRLLSIGTGQNLKYIDKLKANWGSIKWASKIFDILFDGLVDVPDYQCKAILKENYCRVNPRLEDGKIPEMDDWKSRDELVKIGEKIDLTEAIAWLKTNWI